MMGTKEAVLDPRDERLARVLEELDARRRQGQALDLTEVGRQHPDLIDELRQLMAVAEMAEVLGSAQGQATWPPPGPAATTAPSGALPRAFGDYELLAE